MWIGIISIFPEMFHTIMQYGIISRALKKKLIKLYFWNPRDFSKSKNRSIDCAPYGGGSGMLMCIQPLQDAIREAKNSAKIAIVIYFSPQGEILDQNSIQLLYKKYNKFILVCGRYKGIDERIINKDIDKEISIGNYIISGGELAAMIFIDSITRLVPGVLGNNKSAEEDSFFKGLLDCPHYTRPAVYNGQKVPNVLLSGNHEKIKQWRLKQSLGKTWLRRPYFLKKLILNNEQKKLLDEFKQEYNNTKKDF